MPSAVPFTATVPQLLDDGLGQRGKATERSRRIEKNLLSWSQHKKCGGLDNVAIGPSVDVDDLEGYRLLLYNTNNHVT